MLIFQGLIKIIELEYLNGWGGELLFHLFFKMNHF